MADFAWLGLITAIAVLILFIELKRAYHRARKRDQEKMRRHLENLEDESNGEQR